MARQELNPLSGVGDDRLGDTPNAYTAKLNSMTAELYDDVAAAEAAIVANAAAIIANTALITGFTKTYWFDANDTATAVTPIAHTAAATNTYLTNNAIGASTNSYNPDSKTTLWNPATNKFDFTSLKIGDTVEIRADIEVDVLSANQEIDLLMSLAEATAAPYELNISHSYYKSISSANKVTFLFRIYMGDEVTRTGGARFRFASSSAATILVNGWFYQITEV